MTWTLWEAKVEPYLKQVEVDTMNSSMYMSMSNLAISLKVNLFLVISLMRVGKL